jgi:DNA (cytosine-5)-methyltransferase 1
MTQDSRKVIDLFAGVGGISLGAARAGFSISAAVELDKRASQYHGINFPKSKHLIEDVAGLTGKRLLELSDVRRGELSGLVGGPPCQRGPTQ